MWGAMLARSAVTAASSWHPACWLLLTLLLAGCVSLTPDGQPEAMPNAIQSADHWRMKGKLAIRHEGKSRTVSLDWQQSNDQSRILLKGPLGAELAEIKADPTGIEIDLGDGPEPYANTYPRAHPMSDLPWGNLSYWVRGLTGPENQLLPDAFNTGQWQVATLRRNAQGQPTLMTFTHPDISLRLKVKSLQPQKVKSLQPQKAKSLKPL